MRQKTKIKSFIFSVIAFIIGVIAGLSSYTLAMSPKSDTLFSIANGDLSVHFLELGNKYAGDCIYIKANDNDILIDAGSRQSSATTIINYVNQYCKDGILEYVVATHAHQDHIAAFPSNASDSRKGIFKEYTIKTIIDFGDATKSTSQVYANYVEERNNEINNENATWIDVSKWGNDIDNPKITTTFDLGNGITLKILYNYFYNHIDETDDENEYSVCVLISQGDNHILLTGDLEGKGEEYLVQYNDLPQCTLFKANHHGSKTSNTDKLLSVIKPKNIVFTAVAGATEYTTNPANTFPTQIAINNIVKYTANCYVTSVCTNTPAELAVKNYSKFESMNGDIIFSSNKSGYKIECTNNNILLKDTDWFKANRDLPANWA